MATATITCPECDANLRLAKMPAPGKKIRCPKCSAAIAVPEDADTDAPVSRGIQEKSRPTAPAKARPERDAIIGKNGNGRISPKPIPKAVALPRDDEDDDDREQRRRAKRSKRAKESSNTPVIMGAVGAGILVIIIGGVGAWFAFGGSSKGSSSSGSDVASKDSSSRDGSSANDRSSRSSPDGGKGSSGPVRLPPRDRG